MDLSLLVFALAAFVGGFVSGFSGFAMGLIVSGVWLHIITPTQTAALIAGYGLLTQGYGILKLRRVLDLAKAWPLALGTVIGIPIGVSILAYQPGLSAVRRRSAADDLLDLWPGAARVRADEDRHRSRRRDRHLNGLVGGLTGLGGVISTISCQWRGWPKDLQRAVFQPVLFVSFVVISVSQAVAGNITKDTLILYILGVPFMTVGLWFGFRLFGKIDDETFRKTVLSLLMFAGVSLIVPTLPFALRQF